MLSIKGLLRTHETITSFPGSFLKCGPNAGGKIESGVFVIKKS